MICAGGRLFKITVFLSVSTVSEKAHCSWGLAPPSCSMRDVPNKEVTSALASVQTAKKQDQRASAGMMEAAKGLRQEQLERTREALLQSQKMEAIGQLTGGIAHDFNNLLMAVLGSLELLRKRVPDDPKIMALLNNAVQGAQRGAVLTKRMLAFARRQELQFETISVPELVHGMTELLQRSIGQSISIETRFPLALKPIQADANQIEMALLNLVVNARDAMPDGGQIILSAREETLRDEAPGGLSPGRYVRLSVTDTGEGMDKETLARALEPFFTTKGPGKGTGLGLPMVHGLAQQSGGRFNLQSSPGEGTTAELWLPVAQKAPATVGPSVQPDAREERRAEPLVVLAVATTCWSSRTLWPCWRTLVTPPSVLSQEARRSRFFATETRSI
jgi:signal transduction histidine kinase